MSFTLTSQRISVESSEVKSSPHSSVDPLSRSLCTSGVLYVEDAEQPIPFCTVSRSKRHDPTAIWKYLEPLFDHMKESHRNIEVLHFFSDGPKTQYRQMIKLFLFCTKIFDIGYHAGSWNLWEASHGKGAPDGIGGAIKRKADKLISQGNDSYSEPSSDPGNVSEVILCR